MRKLLLNLAVVLTVTSSAIPVTACTFNFYVDRSKDKIKHLLANETSNIVKSLIISNQLDTDTKQTIDDMFSQETQNNIANQSSDGTTINNWGDFSQHWGDNGTITNNGFDQDKFIVPTGQGTLTKQVNSKTSLDSTLSYLTYTSSLNIISNALLYNNILGPNAALKSNIISYLTMLQSPDKLPDSIKSYWPLINNLINNYQNSFLTPITTLLNDLVSGWTNVPTNAQGLKTYMEQWKDGQQPYSQWIDETGKWTLGTKSATVATWTTNDYVWYRGGTLLNYLFKKIGTDSSGKIPSQYLGEIITANIDNPDKIPTVLQPYISALTTSPAYILMLIDGVLPIIKQTLLQMKDTSKGIGHLTIGKGYPTNKDINSWNLLDILNTIKTLTTNPDTTSKVVDNLLSSSFLYDIKIKYLDADIPLPAGLDVLQDTKKQLIKTITDFLTGTKFQGIFNSIYDLVNKLNDQFPSGGIDLDLTKLQELLIGNNGLLIQLNIVAQKLGVIIKPDHHVTEQDLDTLYTSLGGIIPTKGHSAGDSFTPNSILDKLKTQFTQKSSPLQSLINIIYNSDGTHEGIAQLIIDSNKKWIQKNYTDYFDINNQNTSIANINFNESTIGKNNIIDLNYYLTFKVKDKNFTFFVKGISRDDKATFTGTHNFKFTEIDLISKN